MFRRAGLDTPTPLLPVWVGLVLFLISGCGTPDPSTETPLQQELAEAPAEAGLELVPPFDLGAGFPVGIALERDSDVLQEGEPVPIFALEFADGTTHSTEKLAGRALLINFWATWCGPCRHEIPIILAQQAQHREDLLVLAVNVKENREIVTDFAAEFAMNVPVILDPSGDIVRQFEVRGYPTSIFVDADGELVARWQGVLDAAKLEELVNASLAGVD